MFGIVQFNFFAPSAAKPKPFQNTEVAKDLSRGRLIDSGSKALPRSSRLSNGTLQSRHYRVVWTGPESISLPSNFQVPKARLTGFHPRYRPLIDDSRMARAFSLTRRCLVSRQTIVPRSSPLNCGALQGRIPLKAKRTVDKALELRVLSAHPLE